MSAGLPRCQWCGGCLTVASLCYIMSSIIYHEHDAPVAHADGLLVRRRGRHHLVAGAKAPVQPIVAAVQQRQLQPAAPSTRSHSDRLTPDEQQSHVACPAHPSHDNVHTQVHMYCSWSRQVANLWRQVLVHVIDCGGQHLQQCSGSIIHTQASWHTQGNSCTDYRHSQQHTSVSIFSL